MATIFLSETGGVSTPYNILLKLKKQFRSTKTKLRKKKEGGEGASSRNKEGYEKDPRHYYKEPG